MKEKEEMAYWIRYKAINPSKCNIQECSVCGYEVFRHIKTNFCPNCGRKIKQEKPTKKKNSELGKFEDDILKFSKLSKFTKEDFLADVTINRKEYKIIGFIPRNKFSVVCERKTDKRQFSFLPETVENALGR